MLKYIVSITALCMSAFVMAAGPLVLEGPAGNTPASYENPNIIFNIESGPLGPARDNDAADQLVLNAFAMWNNIPTSIINLNQGTDIPVDIDENNFNSYIPDPVNTFIHNSNDCLNPVVYDSDGSIIDAFFYSGASDNVVGFAASTIFIGASYFTEGFAVINGKPLPNLTDNALTLIIAHELGHAFGLDHSQANIDNTEQFTINSCETAASNSEYPLMYPYACRETQNIHPDDATSVSMLYPTADYYSTHGQLSGTFESVTTPVLGANLWVQDTNTGAVHSVVSDYLKQGTGFFSLMLPEGTYELHANSINNEFYEGSSVGPYANSPIDISFQSPAGVLGSDIVFDAGGSPPALLTVTAGEATHVTFKTDGSGSFTTNNEIINLSPSHNTIATCTVTPTTNSGGGSPSPGLLVALFGIPLLRLAERRSS